VDLLVEAAEPHPKLLADVSVERPEGLVEEQHLWLDGERPGERHALALPARELRRIAVGDAVQDRDEAAAVISDDVDILVRPEELRITAVSGGNGIVVDRTFLGSVTRVSARLSGDVTVKVDLPSTGAAAMSPGTSVEVSLAGTPVLVAERR